MVVPFDVGCRDCGSVFEQWLGVCGCLSPVRHGRVGTSTAPNDKVDRLGAVRHGLHYGPHKRSPGAVRLHRLHVSPGG
jgi:hypothetical protein